MLIFVLFRKSVKTVRSVNRSLSNYDQMMYKTILYLSRGPRLTLTHKNRILLVIISVNFHSLYVETICMECRSLFSVKKKMKDIYVKMLAEFFIKHAKC